VSATVAFRSRSIRLIFEGQSMNLQPTASRYPNQMMASHPDVPWDNVAVSATSWTMLAKSRAQRTLPRLTLAQKTIIVMNGGYTDLSGEADSGATLLQDEKDYADVLRAAATTGGRSCYIIISTLCKWGSISAPIETERQAHNSALLADSSGKFDAVVDVAGDSRLTDPTNHTYFQAFDELHYTAAGAAVNAELVAACPLIKEHLGT
jgi:hypothetical protein